MVGNNSKDEGYIVEVRNLKVEYPGQKGSVMAVDDISFSLKRGESLGIAGESGCGKSTLGYALLGLLPVPGRIVGGSIFVDGKEITNMSSNELRRTRWEVISMVFQGALNSLNPVYNIGKQMVETATIHRPEMNPQDAKDMVTKSVELVGLHRDALKRYPHELSGGMKQRVVIAMALMLQPKVLIADEPTTALDVIVQAQIIRLLKDLQQRLGMSLIFISHDLSMISEMADRVAIMYAGKFAEYGPLEAIYRRPKHPYTHLLLKSVPVLGETEKLTYIAGEPPDLKAPPPGCRFHPRCPFAIPLCSSEAPSLNEIEDQLAACLRSKEHLW